MSGCYSVSNIVPWTPSHCFEFSWTSLQKSKLLLNKDESWNEQSVIDNRPADNRPKHYRCTSSCTFTLHDILERFNGADIEQVKFTRTFITSIKLQNKITLQNAQLIVQRCVHNQGCPSTLNADKRPPPQDAPTARLPSLPHSFPFHSPKKLR